MLLTVKILIILVNKIVERKEKMKIKNPERFKSKS